MTSIGNKAVDPKELLTLPGDELEPSEVVIENPMNTEELQVCANAWKIDLSRYEQR